MLCSIFLNIYLLNAYISSVYLPQLLGASIATSNEPEDTSSRSESKNYQENAHEKSSEKSDWRIVGGHDCSEKEIPFIVSIRGSRNSQHFCAGTLITPRFVLSVAHCFDQILNKLNLIEAVVGSSNIGRSTGQVVYIENIILHAQFDNDSMMNDISLIRLAENVNMYIGVVDFVKLPTHPLPEDLSKVCDANSFIVSGWGDKRVFGAHEIPTEFRPSRRLQCVNVPYITNAECRKYAKEAFNEKVICALQEGGGKDACQGDSGGPLICGGVQYGIVSWGRGCAAIDSPGFYTRVDRYLDFITESMKSNSCKNLAPRKFVRLTFIPLILIKFLH